MTLEQRGELAFKIAGIAFLLRAVVNLSSLLPPGGVGSWGDHPTLAIWYIGMPALCAIAGALLIGFSGLLSALLLKPQRNPGWELQEEACCIGIAILAVSALILALNALLIVVICVIHGFGMQGIGLALAFAVNGTFAFFALARLGQFVSLLKPRMAVRAKVAGGFARILSVGLTLLGVWFCRGYLISVLSALVVWLFVPPAPVVLWKRVFGPSSFWEVFASTVVPCMFGLVFSLALVLWAGRMASFFARLARRAEVPAVPVITPSSKTYVLVAVQIGLFCLLGGYLRWILWLASYLWGLTGMGRSFVFGVVVWWPPVLAILSGVAAAVALLFLLSRFVPKVARVLCPGEAAPSAEEAARAHGMLETGIAVVALYYAVTSAFGRYWLIGGGITVTVLWLLVLAFRSDIARLFHPLALGKGGAGRAQRALSVYPWLILLGLIFVVTDFYQTAPWLVDFLLTGKSSMVWPFRTMAGIILVLSAPWLSQCLSYGRLIPRIWPRAAPL